MHVYYYSTPTDVFTLRRHNRIMRVLLTQFSLSGFGCSCKKDYQSFFFLRVEPLSTFLVHRKVVVRPRDPR